MQVRCVGAMQSRDFCREHFIDAVFVQCFQLLQRKGVDEDANCLIEIGAGLGPGRPNQSACRQDPRPGQAAGFIGLVVDRKLKRTEVPISINSEPWTSSVDGGFGSSQQSSSSKVGWSVTSSGISRILSRWRSISRLATEAGQVVPEGVKGIPAPNGRQTHVVSSLGSE